MSKKGKRIAGLVLGLVFAVICSIHLWAWDPAGTWRIEGRSDATIVISKVEDHYVIDIQTAYSKQKAIGYFYGDQLIVAYAVLTEAQCGFNVYKRLDDRRMSEVSMNTDGASVWKGVLVRK